MANNCDLMLCTTDVALLHAVVQLRPHVVYNCCCTVACCCTTATSCCVQLMLHCCTLLYNCNLMLCTTDVTLLNAVVQLRPHVVYNWCCTATQCCTTLKSLQRLSIRHLPPVLMSLKRKSATPLMITSQRSEQHFSSEKSPETLKAFLW